MTRHLQTNAALYINKNRWQSLPGDVQQILIEAGNEAGDFYTNLAEEMWRKDVAEIKEEKKNVEFIELGDHIFLFRERAKKLAEELENKGYWSKGLYEKIQELAP